MKCAIIGIALIVASESVKGNPFPPLTLIPHVGVRNVASHLGLSSATGGEFEEGVSGRREVEMVVLIAGVWLVSGTGAI